MNSFNRRETYVLLLVGILFGVSLVVVLSLRQIFLPVFLSILLAYLIEPIVRLLEQKGVRRSLAVVAVFFLFLAAGFSVGLLFVSSLGEEFRNIQINLPEYASRLYNTIPPQVKVYLEIETPDKVYAQINRIMLAIQGVSLDLFKETFILIRKAFASTLSLVLGLLGYLIIPIYLYYFLKDMPKLHALLNDLIPVRYRDAWHERGGEIGVLLSAFIRGQLSVCGILAVLYSVGLFAIGIDLAILIGTTAGVAFIIPYFGTILGIVLSMAMAFLKFHDILHPLLCLGWFCIVQGIEGGIVTPWIVGDKVGLHPMITIIALLVGGQLFGVLGMLLAVPVAAVCKVFLRSVVQLYRETGFYRGEA